MFIDSFDLHCGWVNSAALSLMEITADTPDPIGGEIRRLHFGKILEAGAPALVKRAFVRALEERGVLRGYRALVQPEALGLGAVLAYSWGWVSPLAWRCSTSCPPSTSCSRWKPSCKLGTHGRGRAGSTSRIGC